MLRAIMGISVRAISLPDRPQRGHSGHQCSHAPGRPILHLVLVLSQTSAGKTFQLFELNHAAGILLASKARPQAKTLQAMRASLLASAMARTL